MKDFKGYVIVNDNGKPEQNSIKAGRYYCIENWLKHAPFGDWNVAKDFGYRCKKVNIQLELL